MYAENLLMQGNGPRDLLQRIFRMMEALPGQRQSGVGDSSCIGITQQREDGMIKRRGGDFDATTLRRRRVGRQHFGEQLTLPADDELLVIQAVIASLVD